MTDELDTNGYPIADPAEPEGEAVNAGDDQKRVNDLMSKWQKAEARANAAEAREQVLVTAAAAAPGGTPDVGNPEQWIALLREQARDQIYRSDPRLARYGIEASAIQGGTPDQMRASLASQAVLIDRIEGQVSSDVLKKHGLNPDLKGGGRPPTTPDITKMSEADFDALVASVKEG